ncbi:hypothetical protein ACVGVM_20280 [Pseudonocardia bannensis]|uniref:Uncharacterized protein n=1 Tax=Pseudonocardia bannensis TaxID=630973 RepID=A0A848DFE4_9PSEU|nr:hypothetical protein [Pseudonocardia bannensis]NMH91285.1 hypothetical protein [Pseudonocardia bannensis]
MNQTKGHRVPGQVAGQGLLFDDLVTDRVLRLARDPGYVLLGPADTVYQRATHTRDAERAMPVAADEATTVHHLLTAGRLTLGHRIAVVAEQPEPQMATVVEPAAPAATQPEGPRSVRVLVDVVSPGKGLVTCGDGDWSGAIVRDGSSYLVETETGDVIGRARSYGHGAERLARHHGHRATAVEIEHEREFW